METTPFNPDLKQYFIDSCRTKLVKEYLPKMKAAVAELSDEDVWWREHESNNSIGNLILHLVGNVSEWIVLSLGNQEFLRNRNQEFNERNHLPLSELLSRLDLAVQAADQVLAQFPVEKLGEKFTIQKYEVSGMEAILHVTEHFSYHLGQIVYISKLRTGRDLKFYNL